MIRSFGPTKKPGKGLDLSRLWNSRIKSKVGFQRLLILAFLFTTLTTLLSLLPLLLFLLALLALLAFLPLTLALLALLVLVLLTLDLLALILLLIDSLGAFFAPFLAALVHGSLAGVGGILLLLLSLLGTFHELGGRTPGTLLFVPFLFVIAIAHTNLQEVNRREDFGISGSL